jgi:hypothetical protein
MQPTDYNLQDLPSLVRFLPALESLRGLVIECRPHDDMWWSLLPDFFSPITFTTLLPAGLHNVTFVALIGNEGIKFMIFLLAARVMLLPTLHHLYMSGIIAPNQRTEEEDQMIRARYGTSGLAILEIEDSILDIFCVTHLFRLPRALTHVTLSLMGDECGTLSAFNDELSVHRATLQVLEVDVEDYEDIDGVGTLGDLGAYVAMRRLEARFRDLWSADSADASLAVTLPPNLTALVIDLRHFYHEATDDSAVKQAQALEQVIETVRKFAPLKSLTILGHELEDKVGLIREECDARGIRFEVAEARL